jgi:hypothetical protein
MSWANSSSFIQQKLDNGLRQDDERATTAAKRLPFPNLFTHLRVTERARPLPAPPHDTTRPPTQDKPQTVVISIRWRSSISGHQISAVRAFDRRGLIARFALSRQSRRSPNRLYCYTASRSPLAISLSSRATDQQLCFASPVPTPGIRTRSIPRPSAARLHPTAWPDFKQIRIDHTSAILRAARSVFRTFPSRPSTPALAISKVGIFRRLQRPLASGSHPFPFVRLSAPSFPPSQHL